MKDGDLDPWGQVVYSPNPSTEILSFLFGFAGFVETFNPTRGATRF